MTLNLLVRKSSKTLKGLMDTQESLTASVQLLFFAVSGLGWTVLFVIQCVGLKPTVLMLNWSHTHMLLM